MGTFFYLWRDGRETPRYSKMDENTLRQTAKTQSDTKITRIVLEDGLPILRNQVQNELNAVRDGNLSRLVDLSKLSQLVDLLKHIDEALTTTSTATKPENMCVVGFAGGQMEHRIETNHATGKVTVSLWYSEPRPDERDRMTEDKPKRKEFETNSEAWLWVGQGIGQYHTITNPMTTAKALPLVVAVQHEGQEYRFVLRKDGHGGLTRRDLASGHEVIVAMNCYPADLIEDANRYLPGSEVERIRTIINTL